MEYEEFVRSRITELRLRKNVSEHRMSLDLDKSPSYIRGITNGSALPSLRELFNIMRYFDMTPAAFFAPTEDTQSEAAQLRRRMENLDQETVNKVMTFLDMLGK